MQPLRGKKKQPNRTLPVVWDMRPQVFTTAPPGFALHKAAWVIVGPGRSWLGCLTSSTLFAFGKTDQPEGLLYMRQILRSLQKKRITTAPTPAHSQVLTSVKLKQVQLPFKNTLVLKRLCLHLPYTGLQKSDYISSPGLKEKVAFDKRKWICYTWRWSTAIQSKVIYHSVSLYWPVSFSIYKNSSGLILSLYRRNPLDLLSWSTSFVSSWTESWHIKLNTIWTTSTEYLVKGS